MTSLPVGEYLFRRLQSVGVSTIFGVPGDFNLNLLDHLDSVPGLVWEGTRNELNGSYAADGYSRSRGGSVPGVVVTTYGVGELSAANGIGAALAERVPVVHVVGMSSRIARARPHLLVHHSPGQGRDQLMYTRVAEPMVATVAMLDHEESFISEIDRAIRVAMEERRPTYIGVPADVADIVIDSSQLDNPLDLTIRNSGQEAVEDQVVDQIMALVKSAKKPSLLVDMLAHRFSLDAEVQQIVSQSGIAAFTTPLAKSAIDENSPTFGGLYLGIHSMPETKEAVESSDVVLFVGNYPTDMNTGLFTQKLATFGTLVSLHTDYVGIGEKKWQGLSFVPVVKKLAQRVKTENFVLSPEQQLITQPPSRRPVPRNRGPLRHRHFWDYWENFLADDDCVIIEVGSSQYSAVDLKLPSRVEYYTQMFYNSIGYSVPATLGSLAARRDMQKPGRMILFVGDGSLQMTVQEISTMIHSGFKPLIVIINNSGYTIERVIHGPTRKYNDINPWNYTTLLTAFGATSLNSASYTVRTYEELDSLLNNKHFAACDKIQVVECILDRYDSPSRLTGFVDRMVTSSSIAMQQADKEMGRERRTIDGTLSASGLTVTVEETSEQISKGCIIS